MWCLWLTKHSYFTDDLFGLYCKLGADVPFFAFLKYNGFDIKRKEDFGKPMESAGGMGLTVKHVLFLSCPCSTG